MDELRSCYVSSDLLTCPHGFSTRRGGVSTGIFTSLNLGRLDRGDVPGRVARNWEIFGEALGICTARFVHGKQVHGASVRIVSREDAHGILETSELEADGYVTDIPGLPLAVFTADCTPLLMQEPDAGVVAAVHCGWRGTMADIAGEAVRQMSALGADPSRIRAAIGPGIRRCCFQTGPEVPAAAERLLGPKAAADLWGPDPGQDGKFRVDLPGVVKQRLVQLGLREEHIDDLGECTMCRPDKYWSHRAMGPDRGSQANIIAL
ncbi:MAG: laccase domain-containing protein [Oscillospiraceae bacterium]|nr:laccase domain-containing protein [Oscillospiraceae bacterium]